MYTSFIKRVTAQHMNQQKLTFALAIAAPISAFNVEYVGYWDDACELEVTGGQFSDVYNCYGFDGWTVSSYKIYNTGDACPEGQSLQVTFYATSGNGGAVCGTDPLVVVPVGESQACVKGFNATPVVAEAACA
ncbi:hypothetical protein F5884DRAFT_743575 [Xylogone sp. PMI_703]|nr:hypothetical protein F5884DRAFT_743575 [Xylogone sp. PMI_703]